MPSEKIHQRFMEYGVRRKLPRKGEDRNKDSFWCNVIRTISLSGLRNARDFVRNYETHTSIWGMTFWRLIDFVIIPTIEIALLKIKRDSSATVSKSETIFVLKRNFREFQFHLFRMNKFHHLLFVNWILTIIHSLGTIKCDILSNCLDYWRDSCERSLSFGKNILDNKLWF